MEIWGHKLGSRIAQMRMTGESRARGHRNTVIWGRQDCLRGGGAVGFSVYPPELSPGAPDSDREGDAINKCPGFGKRRRYLGV